MVDWRQKERKVEAPEGGAAAAEGGERPPVERPAQVLLAVGLGHNGSPRVTVSVATGEGRMVTAFLLPETARVFAAQMETMARVAEDEAK